MKTPKYSDVTREKEKQLGEKAGLEGRPRADAVRQRWVARPLERSHADRSRSLVFSQRSSFLEKEEGV